MGNLYDKRGRNNQGKVMFHGHQGGGNSSDMNVGSQGSMGYHQRNQTQIAGPAADSIFRSSIMSTDIQAQV